MSNHLKASVLLLLLLPVVSLAAGTEQQVTEILARSADLSVPEAWDLATGIAQIKETDAVKQLLEMRLDTAGPIERLVIGRTYSLLDEPGLAIGVFASVFNDTQAPEELRVLMPIWRFSGQLDNGSSFQIWVQAVSSEYIRQTG